MTLDTLAPNEQAVVTHVDWDALVVEEGKRLRALGIDEGATVFVAYRGVFGGRDPVAVVVGTMTIAVRRAHAAAISIDPA